MNKEKEIEDMARILGECHFTSCQECRRQSNCPYCNLFEQAKILHNAGYRKSDEVRKETAVKLDEDKIKKQAVRKFAEKLKEELWKFDGSWQEYDGEELCETVDNLITELYGADE